jgi:TrkA domain protein
VTQPRLRTTPLPGIGVQYDLVTLEGHHLSVVAHRDGSRSLNGYHADDPDACALSVHLSEPEAGALTDALQPPHHEPMLLHTTELGLVVERIGLASASRWNGRQLGDTRLRTRTGSSVVAILRGPYPIPSPAPVFRLGGGDVMILVGTREGADAAAAILAEE